MKRIYAEYTPEMVAEICGMPVEEFIEVAELFTSTGRPDKAGNIMYAMGMDPATPGLAEHAGGGHAADAAGQHRHPRRRHRTALRGEANVQGSTDMAMLWHDLPGYLAMPTAAQHPTLDGSYQATTPKSGYWDEPAQVHGLAAEGLVGRERHGRERLLPTTTCRRWTTGETYSHMTIFESMGSTAA